MNYETDPRYSTFEYPVISVVDESAANGSLPRSPDLETAKFLSNCGPEGGAVVRLDGKLVDPKEIGCCAVTPGFAAVLRPERTVYRKAVIVGVTFRRTDPNAGGRCVVRFSCGDSYTEASITVPKH